MNSKRIGNIGEVKALSKFVELGLPVYLPFGDTEKCDLIVEFNGKLNRIQVKTSVKSENGVMKFSLNSCSLHRSKGFKHFYNKLEVDYFVLYNISRDSLMMINIEDVGNDAVTIRYLEPKNKQSKGVRYEKDYTVEKIIKQSSEA